MTKIRPTYYALALSTAQAQWSAQVACTLALMRMRSNIDSPAGLAKHDDSIRSALIDERRAWAHLETVSHRVALALAGSPQ